MYSARGIFLLVFLLSTLTACTPSAPSGSTAPSDLVVFAAASLTDAFSQMGKVVESEHPGVKVIFNDAGSQQLAQQIVQGAPADVFASADPQKMQTVISAGRVDAGTEQTLVHNRLVIVTPAGNPGQIKTLADLAKPGLKIVLAAKEVPVGQYSLVFLDNAAGTAGLGSAYKENVLKNVVSYEENVRAVLSKVSLGEADAGIVYTSDVVSADPATVQEIDIPDDLNVTATYVIAPLKDSANPGLAAEFIEYVLSPAGQEILKGQGFIPAR